VKVGVVERQVVSSEQVTRLANLPPRDQLLAAIAGSLTAGVGGIAGVLNSLVRDIAYMVEEVAKQGEQ
jgi:large subunit ribosomal protein L10